MPAETHPKLDAALDALRTGNLVIYPTETFYGIAADIACAEALDRLSALKERDTISPFALIAANMVSAFALAREVPSLARYFAEAFWPGPLTMVLPARSGLHDSIIGPAGVGVRVSPHPIARALARGLGRPITATSANLKGWPPVHAASDLDPALKSMIKLILEDDEMSGDLPSTVVEVRGDSYRIARSGAINESMLAAAIQVRL